MARSSSLIDAAQNYDVVEVINRGLAYAIILAGFLSVIFIFIGGISFILSGGQDDKIKSAVGTIRYAIIGLIVTVLAVFVVDAVGKALGLNVIKYINFGDVLQFVTSIGSTTSSGGPSSLN
jgi:uncharacterized membrane protein